MRTHVVHHLTVRLRATHQLARLLVPHEHAPAVAARRDVRVVARERDALEKRLDVFVPHVFLHPRRRRQRGVLVEERPRVPRAPGVALRSRGTGNATPIGEIRRRNRIVLVFGRVRIGLAACRFPRSARLSPRSALSGEAYPNSGDRERPSSSSYPSRDPPAVHPRPTWTRVPPPASCLRSHVVPRPLGDFIDDVQVFAAYVTPPAPLARCTPAPTRRRTVISAC